MEEGGECWDYILCGREKGGKNAHELGVCPAYLQKDSEEYCWEIAGTFCKGKIQGTQAQKKQSCMTCDYLKANHSLYKASFKRVQDKVYDKLKQ